MFRSSDSVYIFYYMECFLLRSCYYSFPNQFELFMHAYRIDIIDLPSSPAQGSDSSLSLMTSAPGSTTSLDTFKV